jgi:hypothetical protein
VRDFGEPYLGPTTVTPNETVQTLETQNLFVQSDITVEAIPSDYVGSDVPRRDDEDLTASGATVSVPAGFYEDDASATIASGDVVFPTTTITANPGISVNAEGLVTGTVNLRNAIPGIVNPGYVDHVNNVNVNVQGTSTLQLGTTAGTTITPNRTTQIAVPSGRFTTGDVLVGPTPPPDLQAKANIEPTESSQTVEPDAGYDGLSSVQINGIDPDYVGSGITRRSSTDMTTSGATVSAPAGYYETGASKAVASGTVGTPTATKSSVRNHSVSVTPSVTSDTGYITGGTKTGTAVTVTASELVSGTKTIESNGTGIDVTNYASVDVDVPAPEQSYTARILRMDSDFVSGGVLYNGVLYRETGRSFTFHAGDTMTVQAYTRGIGHIYYNDTYVAEIDVDGAVPTFDITLPADDIGLRLLGNIAFDAANIYIYENESVTVIPLTADSNFTYRAPTGQAYNPVTVNVPAPSLQAKTNIAPSTSSQTITADAGYDGLSSVQINAMPTGTAGTPTAAKGTVSNHSIAVTPSVTNTTGYITGGTKTGTAVTVSASELVSGTKSITANDTGIDVTNYASVDVAVPAPTPTLQAKTHIEPTESSQTVTPDSGYDGLSSVQIDGIDPDYVGPNVTRRTSSDMTTSGATVTAPAGYYENGASKSVASGTAGTPTATKGAVSNHSVSVTPSVANTTGYITGGTKTGTALTITAAELVSGTKSISENGTGIDVTNYASVDVNVASSGGESSWTKLAEQDITVSTSSTSETQVGGFPNLAASAVWTSAKMIYVRVRDKAGKRNGYFYGSDTFYSNPNPAKGSTTALTSKVCIAYKVPDTGLTAIYVSPVGVYGSDISVSNNLAALNIKSKYGRASSLTIDGTYHVEVYTLEWPDNVSPFA